MRISHLNYHHVYSERREYEHKLPSTWTRCCLPVRYSVEILEYLPPTSTDCNLYIMYIYLCIWRMEGGMKVFVCERECGCGCSCGCTCVPYRPVSEFGTANHGASITGVSVNCHAFASRFWRARPWASAPAAPSARVLALSVVRDIVSAADDPLVPALFDNQQPCFISFCKYPKWTLPTKGRSTRCESHKLVKSGANRRLKARGLSRAHEAASSTRGRRDTGLGPF